MFKMMAFKYRVISACNVDVINDVIMMSLTTVLYN